MIDRVFFKVIHNCQMANEYLQQGILPQSHPVELSLKHEREGWSPSAALHPPDLRTRTNRCDSCCSSLPCCWSVWDRGNINKVRDAKHASAYHRPKEPNFIRPHATYIQNPEGLTSSAQVTNLSAYTME